MVGTSADNSNIDPVPLVPACIAIHYVDTVPGVEIVDRPLAIDLPYL